MIDFRIFFLLAMTELLFSLHSVEGAMQSEPAGFMQLQDQLFVYESGQGDWNTHLIMDGEGFFSGVYQDREKLDAGYAYPHGTVYYNRFSGRFSQPEEAEGVLRFYIKELNLERSPGETEIRNNTRYIYWQPYGLEEGDAFSADLKKEDSADFVPCVLRNMETGEEFLPLEGGIPALTHDFWYRLIENARYNDHILEEILYYGALPQQGMNQVQREKYQVWADCLEEILTFLQEILDQEDEELLELRIKDFYASRSDEVFENADEWQFGSMRGFIEYASGAGLTRELVYELAKVYGNLEWAEE